LQEEIVRQTGRDARVAAAEVEWTRCADRAGLPARRDQAVSVAIALARERLESSGVKPNDSVKGLEHLQHEERTLALALFDCNVSFAATESAVFSEHEAKVVRENLPSLENLREQILAFDEHVEHIVAIP
jgi:hypothetical protein